MTISATESTTRKARPTALVLTAQEDGRRILTLAGYVGHHPPADPDGFLPFARGIAPPHVFAAIRDADPLDDCQHRGNLFVSSR